MIKEGLFEVIESIKEKYGQDVAIISCEELNGSLKGNCKRLVVEYMKPSTTYDPISLTRFDENYKCIKKLYYFLIKYSQLLEQSNLMLELKRVLRIKFTKEKSNRIFYKIKKRVRDLPPCEEWF